ncbi:RNA polymerase sigma factor [Inquilinus sp.]|jgi:RNA polymerase sigma-70 factor (ECF subfamily)|uniref:RNA polymerase sigma factor n=1 Tax=Inquilinus sp. TaxID=1932117 RepID=UPI003784051D
MSAISAATEQQFIATVAPCIPDLRHFAVGLTRNHADADDLIQDTLFRAVRKLDLWQPGTNMMAWLVVMMRRLYLSKVTTVPYKAQIISIDDWEASTPATQLATIELLQVAARWATLSKDHRDILTMVTLEGNSYDEAAQRLEIPTGTVRSRLARARNHLREEMLH